MSLIFATQLTGVATAVLAVFAIITAIYAIRAFRKQAQEVNDQASMLEVQSGQLAEQRRINERQTEVLELQAKELRASLDAREQASLELRYQYASTIVVWQDSRRCLGDAASA